MDYNPYNRNSISQNDLYQRKIDKLNETNNWILGNSFIQNNNNINNFYIKNNNIISENRKDNNLLISSYDYNNSIPKILPQNNYSQNNSQYLIYNPISFPKQPQLYPSYQFYPNNSLINSQPINNNNLNDYSLFGSESRRKDEEKFIKKEQYRLELLKQIEEKKRAEEEKKKKLIEEEKREMKKNEEYFKKKKLQAEEQAKKLRERIAKRMQRQQLEDPGYSANILEISKDFENMNKSRQGTSLMNNLTSKNNNINVNMNNNNYIDLDNYYDNDNMFELDNNDMIQEQDNYMKEIDEDYNELRQSINSDIDEMINNNKYKNKSDEYFQLSKFNENIIKKHKQYTNYIFGKSLSPPTPLKIDKNILSNSNNNNDNNKKKKTIDKNKGINLDDFFNKDPPKQYHKGKKNLVKNKAMQNELDKKYSNIFEMLNDTKQYTKKYSANPDSPSESFLTDQTHISESQDINNNESKNKFYLASYYNSTISNSMYDKENNRSGNEEENLVKIEDSSMRTTENKNKSKSLLEKKLINIKENKEDEEDEEDDEENKKMKEENNDTNVNIEDNIEIENNINKDKNNIDENNNINYEEREEKEEKEGENEEEEDNEANKEL